MSFGFRRLTFYFLSFLLPVLVFFALAYSLYSYFVGKGLGIGVAVYSTFIALCYGSHGLSAAVRLFSSDSDIEDH